LASKNTNPLAGLASFYFPLSYPFYIFDHLFSDLASKNTELLASLASVLKNLFTPLRTVFVCVFVATPLYVVDLQVTITFFSWVLSTDKD
jgi:hypothetical protein